MSPGITLAKLVEQQRMLRDLRQAAGRPEFRDWPLRREAFVAETDDKAWEHYAPGLRHEYGVVYRSLYSGYPEIDTTTNLRKWGENTFAVGSPETVAARLREYLATLGTTEFLIRYQLPHIPRSALTDCLYGLRDVMGMLRNT